MKNALKRTAAGLAVALAAGIIPIIPIAPAAAAPCPYPIVAPASQQCLDCVAARNGDYNPCWGEASLPPRSVSPPQELCNNYGACGQSYVTRPTGYHTCASYEVQVGSDCTWGPVTKPPQVAGGSDNFNQHFPDTNLGPPSSQPIAPVIQPQPDVPNWKPAIRPGGPPIGFG